MSKTKKGKQSRGRRPVPRPPAKTWLQRNGIWLGGGALALVAVVVVAVVVSSGGTGKSQSPAAKAGAGLVGGDFHSLVADPATPGRLYVGGHEAVSVSTDSGRTWSAVKSLDGADAMGWSFAGNTAYVTGHPGINRSTDGGASFRKANDGLPDTDVHAFGASGPTLYGAGPVNGVIASTDGGATWETRATQAGRSFFGRILVGPNDDQHLVAADARTGAAESTDGGRTWHGLGGPSSAVWVSRGGTTLYSSGRQGAERSVDNGKTWQSLALPSGATLVEADPTDPKVLYSGVQDGDNVKVWVSRDGGVNWARP